MKLPVQHVDNLDLNHASEEQLDQDVGLGPERARRLVERRPLASWDDVASIEGFTARVVEELRAQGAELGDPHTAVVDDTEGVPTDGHKGAGPATRIS